MAAFINWLTEMFKFQLLSIYFFSKCIECDVIYIYQTTFILNHSFDHKKANYYRRTSNTKKKQII